MSIILVFQKIDPVLKDVVAKLEERNFNFIEFNESDEVNQLAKHIGKVAIIFTDPKSSFAFLKEASFQKLDIFKILYLPKPPIITKEVQSKLSSVHLQIFSPATHPKLIEDICSFYAGNTFEKEAELEFLVHEQIENEPDVVELVTGEEE